MVVILLTAIKMSRRSLYSMSLDSWRSFIDFTRDVSYDQSCVCESNSTPECRKEVGSDRCGNPARAEAK